MAQFVATMASYKLYNTFAIKAYALRVYYMMLQTGFENQNTFGMHKW